MDYPDSDDLKDGKFTDGDPVAGIPASIDSADHMNAVYDELKNVIKEGGLTPKVDDLTQLATSISNMIAAQAPKDVMMNVSGTADAIILTTPEGSNPTAVLSNYDEFTFIVAATNTSSTVTIKIDDLDSVTLAVNSANQIFLTALLTVRYMNGLFCIAKQVDPITGNNVCDIAVIEPMMTDVLLPGEYEVIGSEFNSVDHPIGVAKIMAGSNLIDQATKDTDLEKYSGKFGWVNEGDGSITVTLPDVSGEFFRFDDASGRGINSDQLIGDWKPSEYESHSHGLYMGDDLTVTRSDGFPAPSDSKGYGNENQLPINSSGGDETRPRGHAWKAKTKM